ncbi:type II toxin-antitoxin system RelE/ParE family toxin [Candidatus Pacearchaeota archaeon]|nr:type II toxin-antitoxin system RelE/ParE family toxin [Candidatus Pacearchaeota archaeon]
MIFSVDFSKKASIQFKKMDKQMQKRIIDNLERIQIRPFTFVKRLVGSKYFRLRVGDYRLILDIQQGKLIILVVEIGHRRNVYKND